MNDDALVALDETSPFADLARAESEVANPTHIALPIANRKGSTSEPFATSISTR
ncbi:hypothetical protein PQR37_18735 [Paraburkholderia nemoris]|uniref:hypothetical protein n=1 Tax=Paraburkholderia nemoris TaxID=2793076 RepID=UPI0038BDEB4F